MAPQTQRHRKEEKTMSSFDGAVIKEQGVNFAIAVVKVSLLSQPAARDRALVEFAGAFGGLPTVLMAQDGQGVPTYYGRPDLVDFLASVPIEAIPWQQYTLRNPA
jgi:hypothetical protein